MAENNTKDTKETAAQAAEAREPRTFKERVAATRRTRWWRFGIVALIYLLWVVWMNNYWFLLGLPLLFDIYITGYIPFTTTRGFRPGKSSGQSANSLHCCAAEVCNAAFPFRLTSRPLLNLITFVILENKITLS